MALAAALVGPADAGDVVSATITRLLAGGSSAPVANMDAYLTRAVVNEARSWKRSSARRRSRDARWDRRRTPNAEPTARLTDPEMADALSRLTVRQRAVVFLTYWADLDPAGVAEHLDISEGSVRKHLARARSSLREALS